MNDRNDRNAMSATPPSAARASDFANLARRFLRNTRGFLRNIRTALQTYQVVQNTAQQIQLMQNQVQNELQTLKSINPASFAGLLALLNQGTFTYAMLQDVN